MNQMFACKSLLHPVFNLNFACKFNQYFVLTKENPEF